MTVHDDDSSAFPASPATPGQAESRRARSAFLENAKDCPWLQEYLQLRLEGWDWRKAAYIAWKASPMSGRWPDTQAKLATEVLGLRTDRTIRTWIEKDPTIEERVGRMQVEPLFAWRRDVIEALIRSATTCMGKDGAADRKLFKEWLEKTENKKTADKPGEDRQAAGTSVFEGVSDDELDQVIANLRAAGATGVGATGVADADGVDAESDKA